jgi:hypothetical protein
MLAVGCAHAIAARRPSPETVLATSIIQASIGPLPSIAGSTSSPTLASMAVSDHGAFRLGKIPQLMREASRIARLVIEKLERSSKSEKPIS